MLVFCRTLTERYVHIIHIMLLASVPGFPRFDLRFAFTMVHEIRRLKRGRSGSFHHVNDVR